MPDYSRDIQKLRSAAYEAAKAQVALSKAHRTLSAMGISTTGLENDLVAGYRAAQRAIDKIDRMKAKIAKL